ncbi:MAG: hypothetical protein IKK55_03325 [Clostridia bacterium]|nr:hypothetical protein [Clostridia bacterium]
MKKLISFLLIFAVLLFTLLLLFDPQICIKGAASGIVLCGKIIIPSLFPFTFCVLFILKSGLLKALSFLEKFSKSAFGLDSRMFTVFLLSLIGGYPLGAKMLNESKADPITLSLMLNYCVNAGPAFIIGAVGSGIFSSQKIGVLLFTAHILPPFLLAFLLRKKIKNIPAPKSEDKINIIDNFVISATESSKTLINICSFVILFSVINAYINFFCQKIPALKPFALLLEVTNAISQSRNIILISALLGFGGLCIWCQVFSLCKNFKINYFQFVLCRIFHSSFSALLTFTMIKTFGITVPAVSNGQIFSYNSFANGSAVGISLIIMGIVLMISLTSKNFTGNILEDIV